MTADHDLANRKYRGKVDVVLAPGSHTVCTTALNHTGGEPTTELGCTTVEVGAG